MRPDMMVKGGCCSGGGVLRRGMLRETPSLDRLTGPYRQLPTAAHAHAFVFTMARSLRQLSSWCMTTLMSRFGSLGGCENAKCDRNVRAASFAGRSGAWPSTSLPHPSAAFDVVGRQRHLRRIFASITCRPSQMRHDLRLHARLRSVKLQELEPRSTLAYYASIQEWSTNVMPPYFDRSQHQSYSQ